MKKIYSALAAALFVAALAGSMPANAAGTTATVSWNPVYTYSDGTTVPAGDVASLTVLWDNGGTLTVAGNASSATVPVPCGNRNFTVTVTLKSTAKYPGTSAPSSPPAPYASGVQCTVNPPTGVTVS